MNFNMVTVAGEKCLVPFSHIMLDKQLAETAKLEVLTNSSETFSIL
jgi:hypothetical protein